MTPLQTIIALGEILAAKSDNMVEFGVAQLIVKLAREEEASTRELVFTPSNEGTKKDMPVGPIVEATPSAVRPSISPKVRKGPVDPNSLAGQVLEFLPTLIDVFPKGPTSKVLADRMDADEAHIRAAMRELHDSGQAARVRRSDSPAWHLIPAGYVPPQEELTETQAKVFEAIRAAAGEDGVSQISRNDICDSAHVSKGAIHAVLVALERKGYIHQVEVGRGTTPSKIKALAP
jgi:hypothetical protein